MPYSLCTTQQCKFSCKAMQPVQVYSNHRWRLGTKGESAHLAMVALRCSAALLAVSWQSKQRRTTSWLRWDFRCTGNARR